MLRISQIKMPLSYTKEQLKSQVCKELQISSNEIISIEILKESIDARKKNDIKYVLSVDVSVKNQAICLRHHRINVTLSSSVTYTYRVTGMEKMKFRPVVVGAGPCGLFCAYFLAKEGFSPILLERGQTIENRTNTISKFWSDGCLNTESNVQFGEGGAGTYSDGKLNTMVKDSFGRIHEVLSLFVTFGAPSDILYKNKPHIGTDLLRSVIHNMTDEIVRLGGEICYETKMTDLIIEHNRICGVIVSNKEKPSEYLQCDQLILALGHSARDTFSMLYHHGITMEKKAFAIGVRAEHPQEWIDRAQYGIAAGELPAADYKLTYQSKSGRGVYSFCMCPGGFVVNASSEEHALVVNGMSNHDRSERNANSAIVVTVTPDDFSQIPDYIDSPLAGVAFQRYYEQKCYRNCAGRIPVQLYGDLCKRKKSVTIGTVTPNTKGAYGFGNLRECLPGFVIDSILEAIPEFGRMIPGFSNEETVFDGIETRTSSPLRIMRNEELTSNIDGIYPCGEGAGYAGGIVSAAVDGIKVFETLIKKFHA